MRDWQRRCSSLLNIGRIRNHTEGENWAEFLLCYLKKNKSRDGGNAAAPSIIFFWYSPLSSCWWSRLSPARADTSPTCSVSLQLPFHVFWELVFLFILLLFASPAYSVSLLIKNLPANAGDGRDMGLIPGSGRSPGGGHGYSLQCSFLENPMDRGAWWASVHRVAQSWTRLKWLSIHTHLLWKNQLVIFEAQRKSCPIDTHPNTWRCW